MASFPIGFLYLSFVVLGITATTLIARLASRRNVTALDLALSLFGVSALLGSVVAYYHRPLAFTANALVFSTVAGVGGAFAVLAFNQAVRLGHFGFSNAIYRSSFLVPVLYSVIFLEARLTWKMAAGISLILGGIFFMSWSTAPFDRIRPKTVELRWLVLILLAFLFSGAPRVGQTLTNRQGENYYLYLFLSYLVGTAILLPAVLARRSFNPASLTWGTGAAVASYIGVLGTLKALESLKPPVVFPISLSGPIILGLLISLLLFKEKITPIGWLGALLGLSGIMILAIWR